ncbi:MAG: hypothetical protein K2X99_04575 [Gemmatimonadaceae bacterium]|nr:hypothetical protein [Gemmatimonadaceae bacterium]
MSAPPTSRATWGALAVVAALAMALLLPAFDYVPLWDARIYAACALKLADGDLTGLRCANHPTYAWSLVQAIPQLFAFGSLTTLHLTNVALALAGWHGFHRFLERLLPGDEHRWARVGLVAAVAVHPVLLSSVLHTNPDHGVLAGFLIVLGALAHDDTRGIVLGGLLLVFSKEIGVPLFALAAGLVLLQRVVAAPAGARVATVRAHRWWALPLLLFGADWSVRALRAVESEQWRAAGAGRDFAGFAPLYLRDPVLLNYAIGIGVIGFMWTVSAPAVLDLLLRVLRAPRRAAAPATLGVDAWWAHFLLACTLCATLGLTAYRTFGNLRYFSALYPLWIASGYVALVRFGLPTRARQLIVAGWVALFSVASWRSVDPVSRLAYGTFDGGARPLYATTAITGECCGRGRDQLVYNLEFTGYSGTQDEAFADLEVTTATTIAIPLNAAWHYFSQLDPETRRRTYRWESVMSPRYTDEVTLARRSDPPEQALYFDVSNAAPLGLPAVLERYEVVETRRYVRGAIALRVHRLRRRAP